MAYSEAAKARRKCRANTKDGQPCRNYAAWDDPLGRCGGHGGRVAGQHTPGKTAAHTCHCIAYSWPHRPGSGLCEWPFSPQYRSPMRPGTHAWARKEMRAYLGRYNLQPVAIAAWRLFGAGQFGYHNER